MLELQQFLQVQQNFFDKITEDYSVAVGQKKKKYIYSSFLGCKWNINFLYEVVNDG